MKKLSTRALQLIFSGQFTISFFFFLVLIPHTGYEPQSSSVQGEVQWPTWPETVHMLGIVRSHSRIMRKMYICPLPYS